jgi:hypothetical protein
MLGHTSILAPQILSGSKVAELSFKITFLISPLLVLGNTHEQAISRSPARLRWLSYAVRDTIPMGCTWLDGGVRWRTLMQRASISVPKEAVASLRSKTPTTNLAGLRSPRRLIHTLCDARTSNLITGKLPFTPRVLTMLQGCAHPCNGLKRVEWSCASRASLLD